jgi:HSP20 family protein
MTTRRLAYSHLRLPGETYASVLEVVWEGFLARSAAPPYWRPPVDICETSTELHVKVEIAGVGDDELDVALRDDLLQITGRRQWTAPIGDLHVHMSELRYGPFLVEIEVSDELRGVPVAWRYDRGILLVTLKKQAAQP